MSKERKVISKEVKLEAIKLVEEQGLQASRVAKEFGIASSTLATWLKKYRTTASEGLTVSEKSELKKLREENRTLKLEKELLKKATVYFAKHSK